MEPEGKKEASPIRVMLVDDQELIRTGLRAILEADARLEVAGEASDGTGAVHRLGAIRPDVVLMDIRMPGLDGVEATRRIRENHPRHDVRILVLTTFDQDENVLAALRAGADGFLSKGASPDEIADAIVRVFEGEHALSPKALDALIEHATSEPQRSPDPDIAAAFTRLTPRELEVVTAIVSGLDYQQIAEQMFLSPYTVKTHANRAMMKVDARDRAQLVSLAVQAGIHP